MNFAKAENLQMGSTTRQKLCYTGGHFNVNMDIH